jgi:hypothetical protein
MIIYQVLDDKNYIVNEYQQREKAIRCSEEMAESFPDHCYRIEELIFEETKYPSN